VAKGTDSPLFHLKPGTEEYKKEEAKLIKAICEIDLGDESRFDKPPEEQKKDFEEMKQTINREVEIQQRKAHLKRLEALHQEARGGRRR
tara:strand:+ start:1269 stop:1535 length:267 start_codon:yes stop_codon:yes gene_type:complete